MSSFSFLLGEAGKERCEWRSTKHQQLVRVPGDVRECSQKAERRRAGPDCCWAIAISKVRVSPGLRAGGKLVRRCGSAECSPRPNWRSDICSSKGWQCQKDDRASVSDTLPRPSRANQSPKTILRSCIGREGSASRKLARRALVSGVRRKRKCRRTSATWPACTSRGRGVPRDNNEAAHWFLAAAEQGIPEAQNNLAVLYYKGDGLSRRLSGSCLMGAARCGAGICPGPGRSCVMLRAGQGRIP